MQPRIEKAVFDGLPLASLRCLPTEFFDPEPRYYSEDPTSHRPELTLTVEPDHESNLTEEPVGRELASVVEIKELGNNELPIFAYRKEIGRAVRDNPVTIVVAETGAGKSTQMPQILLNEGWDNVYLTQPRRAAARNVYQRVRNEIAAVRGELAAGSLVSYQTAGERDGPADARIKIVTDGLHLAREIDKSDIRENDVVVIDEVHEWNDNIEILIACAKRAIAENPRLRIVITSATMDAPRLANYFADVCPNVPPIIEVPGRSYNVEWQEKPQSTVVEETIKAAEAIYAAGPEYTGEANGILVFEPGKREIADVIDEIHKRLPTHIAREAVILPLHSKLTVAEQQAAFGIYPGVKIVVATNVAQTSLTIPDIKYVIDSGYERRIELDASGAQGLVLNPVSQADCEQRAGRTGRVGDGFYILTRMDSHTSHVPYLLRDKFPTPEILRTDIVRNTLRVAGIQVDIAELDMFHPVALSVIRPAQDALRTLGALDEQGAITEIGKKMNRFPLRASSARMMVEAERFSERTRSYMAAIAAAKEEGGLPYFAYNMEKRWKALTEETSSDLLAQLDIFIAIQDMSNSKMRELDLDLRNVEQARERYQKVARLASAYSERLLPPTPDEREDLKQCIYAGLVTSIYKYNGAGTYVHVGKPDTVRQISNRSLVRSLPAVIVGDPYRVEYYSGGEIHKKHIVEQVTAATLLNIGRAAMHLVERVPQDVTLRAGKFVEVRRLSLFGIDLGISEEAVAEPSPKLREKVIEHALEHTGPQQRKLRDIKKQLERLAHLAKDPVKQLTHDEIIRLVHLAAPPDVVDPSVIDNNLRAIIQEQGISLDSYISAERRARIIQNAPPELTVEGVTLRLGYRSSWPLVRSYRKADIERLQEEIFLEDGRQVYFIYERKKRTLMELKDALGVSGYNQPQPSFAV